LPPKAVLSRQTT